MMLDVFKQLAKCHVTEFPTECVQRIMALIRQGTLRDNPIEALCCLFTIASWAMGKLHNDHPDDGVIFSGNPEEKTMAADCCKLLADNGNISMPAGFFDGFIAQQLLRLAITYIISLVEDSEGLEELANKVMDWIADQLER